MTDIAATLSTVTAVTAATQQTVAVVEAALREIPPAIAAIERQILVSGTASVAPEQNLVLLRTAHGDVTLSLPALSEQIKSQQRQQILAALQNGKSVQLLIQPGDPLKASLIVPLPQSVESPALRSPLPPGQSTAMLQVGNVFEALVLPQESQNLFATPPHRPAPNAIPPSPLSEGLLSQIKAWTQKIFESAMTSVHASQEKVPTPRLEGNAANPRALPPAPQTPVLALQAGETVNFRLEQTASSLQNLPRPSTGVPIEATLIANSPTGQPVIAAGDSLLLVRQPTTLPVGSKMLLSLVVPEAYAHEAPHTTPESWGALKHVLAALGELDPVLQRHVLQNRLPMPGPQLGGALLFLFAAFRQGDVRGWLGEKSVTALERAGKHAELEHALEDLRLARGQANDAQVGTWHSFHVPVFDQTQMSLLNFYVHRDTAHDEDEQPERQRQGKTRFLIDVTFTRLGAMQFDGFIRPRQLDLILRSEQTLPDDLQKDLHAIFASALSAMDYAGTLNVQNGRQGWMSFSHTASTSLQA